MQKKGFYMLIAIHLLLFFSTLAIQKFYPELLTLTGLFDSIANKKIITMIMPVIIVIYLLVTAIVFLLGTLTVASKTIGRMKAQIKNFIKNLQGDNFYAYDNSWDVENNSVTDIIFISCYCLVAIPIMLRLTFATLAFVALIFLLLYIVSAMFN